ncbi:hypothetical protein EVAR_92152_1 [Eumeta japonica]|uniref:Uncharacterized protein n=1 Tax=Eumeta variegata TaxID=151549 RepID=A0A4C1SYK9_EUMVA|nr:hypothetical protein EVAR_92152_1 [Eumeta japonica]
MAALFVLQKAVSVQCARVVITAGGRNTCGFCGEDAPGLGPRAEYARRDGETIAVYDKVSHSTTEGSSCLRSKWMWALSHASQREASECSKSEELDFTKSIPELPDAAPDTSVYPDPEQPQQGTSKIKKAYCEPCWLFANPASKKIQNVWMEGYDDWKHIVDAIERHETSKIHLDSCLTYQQWRLHTDEEQESVTKKKNLLAPSTF